jgi:hypothetical protein
MRCLTVSAPGSNLLAPPTPGRVLEFPLFTSPIVPLDNADVDVAEILAVGADLLLGSSFDNLLRVHEGLSLWSWSRGAVTSPGPLSYLTIIIGDVTQITNLYAACEGFRWVMKRCDTLEFSAGYYY